MPRIHLSNAILQRSWRRDSRHEPSPKALPTPRRKSHQVPGRLKEYVRRCSNVTQICVTRPPTRSLDEMIRNAGEGRGRGRAVPKTVAGIIARHSPADSSMVCSQELTSAGVRGDPLQQTKRGPGEGPRIAR